MGDARLDYQEIVDSFFDRFLKGDKSPRLDSLPKVTYYTMGINKWQTSDNWPPTGAQPMTMYLSSAGHANSLTGDGVLVTSPPGTDRPDTFTYDPMNPVLSYGGNVCCTDDAISGIGNKGLMVRETAKNLVSGRASSRYLLVEGHYVTGFRVFNFCHGRRRNAMNIRRFFPQRNVTGR